LTGEPNSSAPDTASAVQAAIFRLAPVPHARPTLLIPPGDLLVVHGPSLPPPALRECTHPGLARRLIAVRRRAADAGGGGGGGFGGVEGGGLGGLGGGMGRIPG